MTRLASFCSGVLEVASAVGRRVEDVVGEWVDTRKPRQWERALLRDWLVWYFGDSEADVKSPPVAATVDLLGNEAPPSSWGFQS